MSAPSEPETEPEGEVEPEAEGEPAVEVEPEAEGASTEPEPYWPDAFGQWGPAWHLHVYSFASIFLLLAILTAMSMFHYLKDRKTLKQGTLTFTLQCLLFSFTSLRSTVMFTNPYSTVHHLNGPVFTMLWSFALPGLTASFSVLLLVFLDTTKMTLGPPIFQKLWVLLLFTVCHFVIVVSSDVVCIYNNACKPMLLFCQILFILYGAFLAVGYLYNAICLRRKCLNGIISAEDNRNIVRLIRVSLCASFVSLAIAVTHLYAACSEFGIYSDVIFVSAWNWWILQSVLRLEEVTSCCLILVIAFRCPCRTEKMKSFLTRHFTSKTYPVSNAKKKDETDVTRNASMNISSSKEQKQDRIYVIERRVLVA